MPPRQNMPGSLVISALLAHLRSLWRLSFYGSPANPVLVCCSIAFALVSACSPMIAYQTLWLRIQRYKGGVQPWVHADGSLKGVHQGPAVSRARPGCCTRAGELSARLAAHER
jgi:hypothetical protein